MHQDFFERRFLANFVVPDFNLDPSVLRAACRRIVACRRVQVAFPCVGHTFGRQGQRRLHVLGNLAGTFSREAQVIAVDRDQARREWLVVRMADQVQAHIHAVAHAIEDLAQGCDGRLGICATPVSK